MTPKQHEQNSFAERLKELMQDHTPPLDLKRLAEEADISYEHARKMVRGDTIPTKFIIRTLATFFKVESSPLEALANSDRFSKKYGKHAPASVFNPDIAPFAKGWDMLTETQRVSLLNQLKTYLEKNLARTQQGQA